MSEADVARAVDGRVDPLLVWRVDESRARPATLIALSYRLLEFGAPPEALSPRLFILERRGDGVELVAKAAIEPGDVDCRNDSGASGSDDERAPQLSLDLGNYEIAEKHAAIGVRFTCFRAFPAGEGSETRLLLFEPVESKLRQVLTVGMAHSNLDRPSGKETTSEASLSVEKGQHEGHYDLTIRTTTKTATSDPGALRQSAGTVAEKIEVKRYAWRDGHYGPADDH